MSSGRGEETARKASGLPAPKLSTITMDGSLLGTISVQPRSPKAGAPRSSPHSKSLRSPGAARLRSPPARVYLDKGETEDIYLHTLRTHFVRNGTAEPNIPMSKAPRKHSATSPAAATPGLAPVLPGPAASPGRARLAGGASMLQQQELALWEEREHELLDAQEARLAQLEDALRSREDKHEAYVVHRLEAAAADKVSFLAHQRRALTKQQQLLAQHAQHSRLDLRGKSSPVATVTLPALPRSAAKPLLPASPTLTAAVKEARSDLGLYSLLSNLEARLQSTALTTSPYKALPQPQFDGQRRQAAFSKQLDAVYTRMQVHKSTAGYVAHPLEPLHAKRCPSEGHTPAAVGSVQAEFERGSASAAQSSGDLTPRAAQHCPQLGLATDSKLGSAQQAQQQATVGNPLETPLEDSTEDMHANGASSEEQHVGGDDSEEDAVEEALLRHLQAAKSEGDSTKFGPAGAGQQELGSEDASGSPDANLSTLAVPSPLSETQAVKGDGVAESGNDKQASRPGAAQASPGEQQLQAQGDAGLAAQDGSAASVQTGLLEQGEAAALPTSTPVGPSIPASLPAGPPAARAVGETESVDGGRLTRGSSLRELENSMAIVAAEAGVLAAMQLQEQAMMEEPPSGRTTSRVSAEQLTTRLQKAAEVHVLRLVSAGLETESVESEHSAALAGMGSECVAVGAQEGTMDDAGARADCEAGAGGHWEGCEGTVSKEELAAQLESMANQQLARLQVEGWVELPDTTASVPAGVAC